MKKREIILVVLAVVIVMYGLFDFFKLSGKWQNDEGDEIAAEINKIATFAETTQTELAAVVEKNEFPDMGYLFSKAESKWQNDPFLVYDAKQLDEDVSTDILPELSYNGYIKAGKKILAIVNGMEYAPGEKLKVAGYKVTRITPSTVVLLTEFNKEIILQLEEN